MGTANWDKVISYLKTTKAKPEKVLNMLKTSYGKRSGQESDYEVVRNSWAYIVIGSLANKYGTKDKKKKIPFTQVIRNWVNSKDYQEAWCMFHQKKVKNKKLNRVEWNRSEEEDFNKVSQNRHVRNLNDIWVSKNGKTIRKNLSPNNKFYVTSKFGEYAKKFESDE